MFLQVPYLYFASFIYLIKTVLLKTSFVLKAFLKKIKNKNPNLVDKAAIFPSRKLFHQIDKL